MSNTDKLLDQQKYDEINTHLYIIVLRKSARKLLEFVDCFKQKKYAHSEIIKVKYELSSCRPEVLNILLAMAKEPDRFEFSYTSAADRMVFLDSVNDTSFQIYNHHSRPFNRVENTNNSATVYINGEKFLTSTESWIMLQVAKSMDHMRKSGYKLQAELTALEVQKNVFEIYKN